MDIIKAFEELHASLMNISPLLFSYFADLKKQGFTDEQALELTKEAQQVILKGGN